MGWSGAPSGSAELLSFLIADIRGYTAFTQSRGDEAAAALAGKFAGVAREGIEAHDGRLLELRGDEALAVFTSARASLRAAVALQEVFADETRLDPGLPLTVGIGLDAGEVVPVEGGYRGGALNRAARLCSLAKAGEALASEGVTHLAGTVDEVTFTEWGTAQVKGLSDPVRAFLVASSNGTGLVPQFVTLSVVPPALDSAVPMIGRGEELRRLSWAWRTARRGCGQVAVVRGPSGIGKTRLLSAVAEAAAGGGGSVWWFSPATAEPDWDGLRKALAAEAGPALVAVDDVDAGAEAVAEVLAEGGSVAGRPVLAVLALDDEQATDEDLRAVRSLDADLDVALGPLDPDSVRRVAALYLADAVGDLPARLLESTGGVPRRVHQTVASWAEDMATRRLGVLASQAAGTRSEVAVVESALAGTVADLQQVRERTRLYGLGPGRHGPAPDLSPYKGLDSFGPDDAEAFFGRERLVAELVARVAGGGLVGLVGPSGSGKSSLVRAGLIPAVTAGVLPGSQGWVTVVMRPGEHPVQALNVALLPLLPAAVAAELTASEPLLVQLGQNPNSPQVLLVVDQAEELFTVCADEAERGLFVDGLVTAALDPAGQVDVVLTVRADYYGRFADDQRLASAIAANQVLVGPMTAEEYRRAITRPAQRHGVAVEPELVDALVDEVTGQPGALPLLSTALLELWDARTDRTMTLASYQATGGLQAAVARLAESVFGSLDSDQQQASRRMFLRLTGPGVGDTVVKRRVRLTDLAIDEESSALVDLLARRRLLTVGDGAVEVAHEALLREWPRFQDWLEEDREGIRLRAHLTDAAATWDTTGRDTGELYRGARLSATLDWTTVHAQDLSPVEQEFVTASSTEHQRATAHQDRQNRRLRGLLAGAALLLVLALIAGIVAVRQGDQAQKNANSAVAAQTRSDARAAGAKALVTDDIDTSMLLAVAAVRLDDSPATRSSLLANLGKHPALIASMPMAGEKVLRYDVSPDGRSVATYDVAHHVRLYEIDSGELVNEFQAGSADHLSWNSGNVAFSPDGSTLAVATAAATRQPVTLLDADTLEPLDVQPGGVQSWRWQSEDLAYSHDGRVLAVAMRRVQGAAATTAATSSWAVVWEAGDLRRPAERIQLQDGDPFGGPALAVSPDGRLLYTSDPLVRHDLAAGTSVSMDEPLIVGTLDISPDGTLLAATAFGSAGDKVVLLDSRSGEVRRQLPLGINPSTWLVSFSEDGGMLAAFDNGNQEALVWDVATGRLRARLPLADLVEGVEFSPDGSTLYAAGDGDSLRQWDLGGDSRFLAQVAGSPEDPGRVVIAPGGGYVAYQSDLQITFLNIPAGKLGSSLASPPGSSAVKGGWDPHGKLYVVPTGDHVAVWDARSGDVVSQGQPVEADVAGVDFSTDGSRLAIADAAGAVVMVDPGTLQPAGAPVKLDDAPCAVSLGPDNRTAFVVTGVPKTAWEFWRVACSDWSLVDLGSGSVLDRGTLELADDSGIGLIDFSPRGDRVAINLSRSVVELDLKTGRPLRPLVEVHDTSVLSLAYSPDGGQLLTSGTDASTALWDAEPIRLVARVITPTVFSTSQFLADGHSVLVADFYQGSVYRWDTRPEYAIEFACRLAGRDLTEAEWAEQFGDRPFETTCPPAS